MLLAGQLLSTLFGSHGQQQRGPSAADTSPRDFSEGGQGHAPASTEEQQLTGAESQQPFSSGNVPDEGVHTSNQQNQYGDDVDVHQAMQPQSGMHPLLTVTTRLL